MIKTYYMLTKPGIIMGNLITTAAGFALASKGHIDFYLFLQTLVGLGCVIASACVFNNAIDRRADQIMSRTKNRPLATGRIFRAQCNGICRLSRSFRHLCALFIYEHVRRAHSADGFFSFMW